jgi:DNA-binding MarR family transcriptional regulator
MARPLDISDCQDCLCLASRRAALAITRAFERQIRPHGIRITQFSILTRLILGGPIAVSALASALGIERTTLTRNLSVLEREGWARVDPGRDARARIVTATVAGRAKVEAAYPAWRRAQAAARSGIGAAGASSLQRLAANVVT